MGFFRRRRITLVLMFLQLLLFWIVAANEHRSWTAEAHEGFKREMPDYEQFGRLTLANHPVKPESPSSADELDEGRAFGNSHRDSTGVIVLKIIDFPVFLPIYIAVKLFRPYISQRDSFYVLMTVGIPLYWYLICGLAARIMQRRRERRLAH